MTNMGSDRTQGTLSAKPLWQLGLDWLLEANGGGTHPLDRRRARLLARGMRMVGEDPPAKEVSTYIDQLWSGRPEPASMVRESWRSVYRAKTSLGRDRHWHKAPLYEPDRLIEIHDLLPTTEERLATVAYRALDAVVVAAQMPDTTAYLQSKRELDAALIALHHLRYLRFGSGELGFRDTDPEPPRRPK